MTGARRARPDVRSELVSGALPLDPDVVPGEVRRWPVLLAVLLGGCAGGLARYGVTEAWPVPADGFPWALLTVNCSGAALLAVLLVLLADVLPPWPLLRPLLGTGFCGAWTTFSAVVATVDQLVAHGSPGLGVLYLVASLGGGLLAAFVGLGAGRLMGRALC